MVKRRLLGYNRGEAQGLYGVLFTFNCLLFPIVVPYLMTDNVTFFMFHVIHV